MTTNPGEGGESDFQSCHIIIFKMSSFQQQKLLWGMQRNERVWFIQNKYTEAAPEKA